MELSLDTLSRQGGFAGEPVKKELKRVVDGEEVSIDIYVKKLSYHTAINDLKYSSDDSGTTIAAHRIAHCIVSEKGEPIFKPEDVLGIDDKGNPTERGALSDEWTVSLLGLIAEVNGLGKTSP